MLVARRGAQAPRLEGADAVQPPVEFAPFADEMKQLTFDMHQDIGAALAATPGADAEAVERLGGWQEAAKRINKLVSCLVRAVRERETRFQIEIATLRTESVRESLELEAVVSQTLQAVHAQQPNALERALRTVAVANSTCNAWHPHPSPSHGADGPAAAMQEALAMALER